MGTIVGVNTIKDGLVYGYDSNDKSVRFYKGEPTTNLYASYETLVWFNSGTADITSNTTDVEKPYDPRLIGSNLNILKGVVTAAGSIHCGTNIITGLASSGTYSFSIWFRQNRAGASQPYLRTSINNNSLGNFSYNGSIYSGEWPINTWIKITITATIQPNEDGLYLSNYIGGQVGDAVWYYAPQLELKSHATQSVIGTRSVTNSLIDLKKTTTINLTNVSFDSTAHPAFDGTDDYIDSGINLFWTNKNCVSIEFVVKTNSIAGDAAITGKLYTDYGWSLYRSGRGISLVYWDISGSHSNGMDFSFGDVFIDTNKYYHVIYTWDGYSSKSFVNGILTTTFIPTNPANNKIGISNVGIGGYIYLWGNSYFNGSIPVLKFYDRPISLNEVQNNYNSYKGRFNI